MFFTTMCQIEANQQDGLSGQLHRVPTYLKPSQEMYLDGESCSGPSHVRVVKPHIMPG